MSAITNSLNLVKVICLVTPEELAKLRTRNREGTVSERIWRQVRVVATFDNVEVHFGNVDEEAALGGRCQLRDNAWSFKLDWDELEHALKIETFLAFEPFIVARQVQSLLQHVAQHDVTIKKAVHV